MKQIDEMFERFLSSKKPLKKKWQMRVDYENHMIYFFHYQHTIAMYSLDEYEYIVIYLLKDADKRGNQSIQRFLINEDKVDEIKNKVIKNEGVDCYGISRRD